MMAVLLEVSTMDWIRTLSITMLMATAVELCGAEVDYLKEIQPVLKQRCWSCHGALQQQFQLRLDTQPFILKGGESGAAIVPGNADSSPLFQRISSTDPATRMPSEGPPLTPVQIELFRKWIEQGAPAPANEIPEADPREHWAFRLPVRPALPTVKNLGPPTNPIDAFVLAELDRNGLQPGAPADKPTLLRRVYLDLIGVPPTREELHQFLADDSLVAYETVVDRLLQDSRHGERWGRHWLDIWRYSDWYGRRHVPDVWNSAPQIWRWRDWVVRSLNADRGYDYMVQSMLAADEAASSDDEAGVATGYLIRNWYALNHNDWMRSTVEHTGKAFLGLTFNCAHCHDHKYDPIQHDDYFRFRAFFEPISIRQDRVVGEVEPGPFQEYSYGVLRKIQRAGAVRVFDKNPDAKTWFYTGGDERNRVTDRGSIPPGVPGFLSRTNLRIESTSLPPQSFYPALQPGIQQTLLTDAQAAITAAEKEASTVRQTGSAPSAESLQALQAAESALATAETEAQASGKPGVLNGTQSLQLDATGGRRALENGLTALKGLPSGSTIEFQLLILQDAHFNFQLAKDLVQGLTAGMVAFEKGKIISYQPGTFTDFEVGRYDLAAGQQHFEVSFQLDQSSDRCELTVISLSDRKRLVDGVKVALNGWNPVGDKLKGISFDARTGSVVVVDSLSILPPMEVASAINAKPDPVLAFEFESPLYADGLDVGGVEGWSVSKYSAAPATSVVSRSAANPSIFKAMSAVQLARRLVQLPKIRLDAAEAKLTAAKAQFTSLEARIQAEKGKYKLIDGVDSTAATRQASLSEREAALSQSRADVLDKERVLGEAESKPATDANRAKEITAAKAALSTAIAAVAKAETALADPALAEKYTVLSPIYPETSTGRRKALAEWITARDNPLTARVAVNHIWGRHFHVPLVASVYDFGRNGKTPTHPELLDWLAVEFMDSGWSMRRLHRLIVTSEAYRRSTSAKSGGQNAVVDPDNRFLWRMNAGRMEAEVVRDSLLATADKLDLQMGGQELENGDSLKTFRRSIYYSVHPEVGGKSPLGELFDAPDALDCYRRTETIIPQQALALTNSDLVHAMSSAILQKWPPVNAEQGTTDIDSFIVSSFERILSRKPTEAERQVCSESIDQQRELLTKENVPEPLLKACESFIRALFNHNDFVTIR